MRLPSFTKPVPDNGYRWWYMDAVSDDGIHALTAIIFIGSVFSPYYAWARKKGVDCEALRYCSVNLALYGPKTRWSMTERDQKSVTASADSLSIGRSQLRIENSVQMTLDVDELTMPIPARLRGTLSIQLPNYDLPCVALDTGNPQRSDHHWQPIAPQTRISVMMSHPNLQWQGAAYVDSNYGDVPLEKSFKSWTWSRSHGPNETTTVLYDVVEANGKAHQKSMLYDKHGHVCTTKATRSHTLPPTKYWRIPRSTRTPEGVILSNLETLEDTPFYSRSRFIENHGHHQQTSVHESLDLVRFNSAWVRCLLPFRMPRSTRRLLPA